jgi:hypothetical protein
MLDWLDDMDALDGMITATLEATSELLPASLATDELEPASILLRLPEEAEEDNPALETCAELPELNAADEETAGALEAPTTVVLEAAELEGSTEESAREDGIEEAAWLNEDDTWLDNVLLLPALDAGPTTGAELWDAELLPSTVGIPASRRVSRRWANACSADTNVVVTEPELARRLAIAGTLANALVSRSKSTGTAAWVAIGLMLIPLAGFPSLSSDCSKRAIFNTTRAAGSWVPPISRGVMIALAVTDGNTKSPTKKVIVSPGR